MSAGYDNRAHAAHVLEVAGRISDVFLNSQNPRNELSLSDVRYVCASLLGASAKEVAAGQRHEPGIPLWGLIKAYANARVDLERLTSKENMDAFRKASDAVDQALRSMQDDYVEIAATGAAK